MQKAMGRLLEHLGLDWFVLLVGKQPFQEAPAPYPTSRSEIQSKFGDLCDQEKLDDAIEYCTVLLEREGDRSDKVETKAFTLIGITGIATGFITAFGGLLLEQGKIPSMVLLILATVVYICVVVSLMWTIFLAMKVVAVRGYWFTYPSANDIFDLSHASLNYVKRERAIDLFYSFVQNHRVVDRKATYLGGAQIWFRNSVVVLLVLTLLLAVYIPFRPPAPAAGVSTPTQIVGPTGPPSSLPTITHTPAPVPTDTPTGTATAAPTAAVLPSATMKPAVPRAEKITGDKARAALASAPNRR